MEKGPLTASPPKPRRNGAGSELCSCALTHFPPPLKGRRSDQLLGPQKPLGFTPPRSDPEKLASASSPTHPPKKFERMRTSHPVGKTSGLANADYSEVGRHWPHP